MKKQEDFHRPQVQTKKRGRFRHRVMLVLGSLVSFSFLSGILQESASAAQSVPGEVGLGWFFRLTHLPLMVYAILFLIFVLSALNLWFQVKHVAGRVGRLSFWDSLKDLWQANVEWDFAKKSEFNSHKNKLSRRTKGSFRIGSDAVVVSEVVGIPRLSSSSRAAQNSDSIPTPLDGTDHPLPRFFDSKSQGSVSGENSSSASETELKPVSFRFSSALDVPAQGEVDRKDKGMLTVSGFVMGPNAKALPSVLVYLTDLEGNRVGQSCRTSPDTGEYKVLVNEPGKYILRAHKRGMMMENMEGISLPMESGKIEGLNFTMIPDGCVVAGRVLVSETSEPVANAVIRCRSRLGDYTGETLSDAEGNFSIVGVPPNCECYLEILDDIGTRLHVTDNFETVQKNHISLVVNVHKKTPNHLRPNRTSETVPGDDTRVEILDGSSGG